MYTADAQQLLGPITTASGLASAAQLTDVTPSTVISIGQSATPTRLILTKEVADIPMPNSLARQPYLSAEDDPLLAKLWNNDADAVYDEL
jgi:hypothetical protein